MADFTDTIPGPLATEVLAQLGADVIKVGSPARASSTRQLPVFDYLNNGKRTISLDLKSSHGRAAALALVEKSDVVVEGFRPGVMSSFGLGYEHLAPTRPDLVYCSLSGYGDTGPAARRPGHDINYLAAAGVLYRHRGLDGSQVEAPLPAPTVDIVGGLLAALGLLAAITERQRTGRGRRVDTRLSEAALLLGALDLAGVVTTGREAATPPGMAPYYRLFRTSDGRAISLGITPAENHFWRALCAVTGLTEWSDVSFEERLERREELEAALDEVFSSRSLSSWCDLLSGAEIAWAPVATAAEALVDEAFTRPRPGEAGAALPLGVEVRVGQPLGASGADTAGVLAELSCSEAVRSACLADVAGQPSAS